MTTAVTLVLVLLVAGGATRFAGRCSVLARRESALVAAVPEVTDLLVAVLGAGGTVAQAVRLVSERGPAIVRSPFADVLDQLAAGRTLLSSLTDILPSLGPNFRPITAALVSAERDGAPIADLLMRLGEEGRSGRRRMAERRARTLPVQLLFPLVCCSLPAVIIGAVVPLALMALGRIDL